MRIALVAFGTRGDVQPLIALGRRFRERGHEAVVGASPGFAPWVLGHGLEFAAVGQDIEALLRSHAGVVVGRPLRSLRPVLELLREEIEVSFGQTLAAAHGADLLVSGLHPTAPSAAEALGIPHRTLVYCPQALLSRHHPPVGVPWFALPRTVNEMAWSVLGNGFDIALGDALNVHRRRNRLPPIASLLSDLCGGPAIVASDALLGEVPADVAPGVVQTGAITLDEGAALDPALERFLERGDPPVCIGFGSMPDPDPQATTNVILEALGACGCRGVILSGWTGLGEGGVPPGFFVARSAPHAALLPRVAIAVHHGGSGTVAAAARAGVPQIVVPHAADQYYWGEQIRRRGLGSRPIRREKLNAARLARAIREVQADLGTFERARDVAIGLARSDGLSAVVRLLEQAAAETAGRRRAA